MQGTRLWTIVLFFSAFLLLAPLGIAAEEAGVRLVVQYQPGAVKLGDTLGYAEVVGQRRDLQFIRVPADAVAAVREDLRRRPGVRSVVKDAASPVPEVEFREPEPATGEVNALAVAPPPARDASGDPLFSDPAFRHQHYWAAPEQQPERAGASALGEALKATRVAEPPRVAVLDSGVADYPEGARWAGGVNLVSEEAGSGASRPPSEWQVLPDFGGRCDTGPARHGSQIGAILAAPQDNGYGIAGVLPAMELFAARVLDCEGQGGRSDVVDGILWAAGIDPERPGVTPPAEPMDVINISLGAEDQCAPFEQEAIDRARSRGVLVVAAAGNDPDREPGETAPANCDHVLSVTALDAAGDHVVDGVSVGPGADLAAQGFGVAVEDDRSGRWGANGTSFSTPIVTAAAALARANVPGVGVDELENALLRSAHPPSLSAGSRSAGIEASDFGAGIVNALGTLEHLVGARTDPRGATLGPPLEGGRSPALRAAINTALAEGGLAGEPEVLRELRLSEAPPREQVVLFEVAVGDALTLAQGREVAATDSQRMMVGELRDDVDYAIQFCDGSPGDRDCESTALVPVTVD